jgi:uncharacterized PurR-regulated membrane protein YhhQ (DUF165 family)
MYDALIRLAILFSIIFAWVAVIGGAIYLVAAVFKLPLLVTLSVILGWGVFIYSVLFFVGNVTPERVGHRHE